MPQTSPNIDHSMLPARWLRCDADVFARPLQSTKTKSKPPSLPSQRCSSSWAAGWASWMHGMSRCLCWWISVCCVMPWPSICCRWQPGVCGPTGVPSWGGSCRHRILQMPCCETPRSRSSWCGTSRQHPHRPQPRLRMVKATRRRWIPLSPRG